MNWCSMNREDIISIPAGKKMNILIAEKVMDKKPCEHWHMLRLEPWEFIHGVCGHETCYPINYPPHYSSNINAAWGVVEKIKDIHITFDMFYRKNEQKWWVTTHASDNAKDYGIADTAPLAICRAALLAVMDV